MIEKTHTGSIDWTVVIYAQLTAEERADIRTSIKLDPIISEFDTTEQEDHYNERLRKKIQAAIADTRSTIPHDQVMSEMRTLLINKRKAH